MYSSSVCGERDGTSAREQDPVPSLDRNQSRVSLTTQSTINSRGSYLRILKDIPQSMITSTWRCQRKRLWREEMATAVMQNQKLRSQLQLSNLEDVQDSQLPHLPATHLTPEDPPPHVLLLLDLLHQQLHLSSSMPTTP